jgi:hypothetical protein
LKHDDGLSAKRFGLRHEFEFLAYRILYALHTNNNVELLTLLAHVSECLRDDESAKTHPGLQHALAVVNAVHSHDFFTFFQLYKVCVWVWVWELMWVGAYI